MYKGQRVRGKEGKFVINYWGCGTLVCVSCRNASMQGLKWIKPVMNLKSSRRQTLEPAVTWHPQQVYFQSTKSYWFRCVTTHGPTGPRLRSDKCQGIYNETHTPPLVRSKSAWAWTLVLLWTELNWTEQWKKVSWLTDLWWNWREVTRGRNNFFGRFYRSDG